MFPRIEAEDRPSRRCRNSKSRKPPGRNELLGKTPEPEAVPARPIAPLADPITIDDFVKVDLRVGQVKTRRAGEGRGQTASPEGGYRRGRAAHHRRRHRKSL